MRVWDRVRQPCVDQPPMFTVGAPMTMGAPQPVISPMRAAGRLPMRTVALPFAIGVGGCGPAGGGARGPGDWPAHGAGRGGETAGSGGVVRRSFRDVRWGR